MEFSFLNEAVKQVPSLAVLVFIVVMFLRHIQRFADVVMTIHKEASSALHANTHALGQTNELLRAVSRELNGRNGAMSCAEPKGDCEDD